MEVLREYRAYTHNRIFFRFHLRNFFDNVCVFDINHYDVLIRSLKRHAAFFKPMLLTVIQMTNWYLWRFQQ